MGIPQQALGAARGLTYNKALPWYCVTPDSLFVLGYTTNPQVMGLKVTPLQPGVRTQILVRADDTTPQLYWLVLSQSPGTVLYEWTDPNAPKKTLNYLLYADNSMQDTAKAADDERYLTNMMVVWRAMFTTGMPERPAYLAFRRAREYLVDAINLAAWLLERHPDNFAAKVEEMWKLSHTQLARLRIEELQGSDAFHFTDEQLVKVIWGIRNMVKG